MKTFMIADRKAGAIVKIAPVTKKSAKQYHMVSSDWSAIEKCPHCQKGPAVRVDCVIVGPAPAAHHSIVRYPCGTYCRYVWDDAEHTTLAGEYRHPACGSEAG